MFNVDTRGDPEIRGKESPFLHCLIDRAGILAHTTAIHMHLIGHVMFYVSRLCVLQLSSRQRYITYRRILGCILIIYYLITQNLTSCDILLCCDGTYCVPSIVTKSFLLFCANFRGFVSKEICSRSKRIMVLSNYQIIPL